MHQASHVSNLTTAAVWSEPSSHDRPRGALMRPGPATGETPWPGRASAVRDVSALSDLDKIAVRIADVAARLAVLGDRLCDELRASTFP